MKESTKKEIEEEKPNKLEIEIKSMNMGMRVSYTHSCSFAHSFGSLFMMKKKSRNERKKNENLYG